MLTGNQYCILYAIGLVLSLFNVQRGAERKQPLNRFTGPKAIN